MRKRGLKYKSGMRDVYVTGPMIQWANEANEGTKRTNGACVYPMLFGIFGILPGNRILGEELFAKCEKAEGVHHIYWFNSE